MNPNSIDSSSEDHFAVMLPCEQKNFSDFISSLLGKPQTIGRSFDSSFVIRETDLINIYHLVDQRVTQQNDANLIQFVVKVMFTDGSSVALNSLDDFLHYSEIKPLVSIGVHLSWTYLIKFRFKEIPEKQTIELSFKSDLKSQNSSLEEYVGSKHSHFSSSNISLTINHTERSWGVDIEALLTGHLRTFFVYESKAVVFLRDQSGNIGLVSGSLIMLGSLVGSYITTNNFIKSNLAKINDLGKEYIGADSQTILAHKIDVLSGIILSGSWDIFLYKVLGFLIFSFILAIVIGATIASKAYSRHTSFILLTKKTEGIYSQYTAEKDKTVLNLVLSIFIGIGSGIIANILFNKYFST